MSVDPAILSDFITSDLPSSITFPPDLLEHLRDLKTRYIYSYRLLSTYHVILIVIVAAFSVQRLINLRHVRSRQHPPQRDQPREKHKTWSQELPETFYSAPCAIDEVLPLLSYSGEQSTRKTLWSTCRSILMYKPKPLPWLNATMPSNATSLLVIGLLGINVFYLTYCIDFGDTDAPSLIGNRAACLLVANLPWLYMLCAKNQPIQMLTGYSYDTLNILHRRLGEWISFLIVLHSLGMVASWYRYLRPAGLTLWQFLTITYVIFGAMALCCYMVLHITSLKAFRRWWYEMFLGCHIILQVGALALVYLHHRMGRPYIIITLMIYIVDRLFIRLGMKTRSFLANLDVSEDGDTTLVSIDWPMNTYTKASPVDHGMCRGWQPSEHVFVTIPELGPKYSFQAHPFTIASTAPSEAGAHPRLNMIIRAQNGFTRDLLQYAQFHTSALVRLDGPYGSSNALETLQGSDIRVAVAGGTGIAVAYPLLSHCVSVPPVDNDTITKRRIYLIWVVQEASHVSWIGHERLEELRERGVHVVIPPPTRKCGRPDIGKILQHCIQDGLSSETVETRIGVLASGPDPLNRSVRNACSAMVGRGMDVDVVEKNGW